MKVNQIIILLFFSILVLSSFNSFCANTPNHPISFASQKKYLLDSINLEDLTSNDKKLLDSCLKVYHNTLSDTIKIAALNTITSNMVHIYWRKYLILQDSLITKKLNKNTFTNTKEQTFYKSMHASVLGHIAFVKDENGEVLEALNSYLKVYEIFKELEDKDGIAGILNNIGVAYYNIGDVDKGVDYHFKSLKIYEELDNKEGISACLSNIAYVYDDQGEVENALKYYQKSIDISKKIDDLEGMSYALNNIGYILSEANKLSPAIAKFDESLKIRRKIGDEEGIAISLYSKGNVYLKQNKFDEAEDNFLESLEIAKKINDLSSVTLILIGLAEVDIHNGNIKNAEKKALEGFKIAQEIGLPNNIMETARLLSQIYEKQKKGDLALEMYKIHIQMKDSIYNVENERKTIKKQAQYEFEKQKAKNEEKYRQKIAFEHELTEHQKKLKYFSLLGLLILLILLAYIFNRLQVTRNQKQIIEKGKQLIEIQKQSLEEKNNQISSSITYAQLIQMAVLPEIKLENLFPDSFLLYMPKDIVSGDFYWWEENDDSILFAVADCTGHGVPGGFMSMMGSIFLNEIFNSKRIYQPSKVLDELSRLVTISLKNNTEKGLKDGMDISFARLNKKDLTLEWAGAINPLYIVKNDSITIIKGDRQPIGFSINPISFVNHKIQLEKGDCIYLFSDGFADQFGGDNNKKLGYRKFRSKLMEISIQDMHKQKEDLKMLFQEWKKAEEQIDDICILGVRV